MGFRWKVCWREVTLEVKLYRRRDPDHLGLPDLSYAG